MRLGVVQMTSAPDHGANVATVTNAMAQAADVGCDLMALPEVAGCMNRRLDQLGVAIGSEAHDPFISACRDLARDHAIWLHTGSTPIGAGTPGRYLNHSNLIDAAGRIVAAYDKVHLFDYYPDEGRPILESKRYDGGRQAVLAESPWGPVGMSVCYDLRFPALYRAYARAGAVMMVIPSAFTVPTGRAHWEVLLRARAIETGAFVIAAAQVGRHDDGRETYGHSMVVDPWGEVLLDMEQSTGLAVVDLDIGAVAAARSRIPSLDHDREFSLVTVG